MGGGSGGPPRSSEESDRLPYRQHDNQPLFQPGQNAFLLWRLNDGRRVSMKVTWDRNETTSKLMLELSHDGPLGADDWHNCMGHIGEWAQGHLPT